MIWTLAFGAVWCLVSIHNLIWPRQALIRSHRSWQRKLTGPHDDWPVKQVEPKAWEPSEGLVLAVRLLAGVWLLAGLAITGWLLTDQ